MPDQNPNISDGSLCLGLIAALFVFIVIIVLVRFLAWWRNRRVGLREVVVKTPVVDAKFAPQPDPPPNPSAPSISVTSGGDTQVSTGDGARNIQTQGAPYIEQIVVAPSPERPPTGSAAPPARTAHYVQRGKIQNDVRAALESNSTVAVVGVAGMGGIGKTELAKYLYRELQTTHRVIWIGVYERSIGDLQGELGRALGITFSPNADETSRYETLLAVFRENPCIVVFDDVFKAAIPHLKFLLPPSPPCAALITSRQRELGVARVFELDVMTETQSLELLRQAHNLGDVLDREPDAAKKLCELCGYLPLALDIAASRLRKQLHFSATPVAAFNQSLDHRLKELQRGTKPDRLDSVTVNIDLSYAALDDADQKRLRALAVFAPSGFMPRAAAALWGGSEADARASIERLQDESLVMNAKELGRFKLHDLIRDYATQKLNECGESDATNRAHAEFLIELFEENYNITAENIPILREEFDNLVLAANWARAKKESRLLALLATKPRNWLYVNFTSAWDDWLGWLNEALRIGKDYEPALQANVRQAIGDVQQFRDDRDAALTSYAQALELFKAIGDKLGEANVLHRIGDVQRFSDEYDSALNSYSDALKLFRAVGDKLGEANVLAAQCRLYVRMGNLAQGELNLAQVIAIRREIGDLYSEGADYGNFALALVNAGEKAKAKPYALKARQVFEKIGEPSLIQWVDNLIASCD